MGESGLRALTLEDAREIVEARIDRVGGNDVDRRQIVGRKSIG